MDPGILVAFFEEFIKLSIVLFFSKIFSSVSICSIFIFFLFEFLFKLESTYDHSIYLGYGILSAAIPSILVSAGTSSLHIFTSYLYLRSKKLMHTAIFGVSLHYISNFTVIYMPPFGKMFYPIVPIIMSVSYLIICFIYYYICRYLKFDFTNNSEKIGPSEV